MEVGHEAVRASPAILSPSAILTSLTDDHEVRVPSRYARVNAWVISGDTDEEVRFPTSVFERSRLPAFACSIPMETSVTSRSSWAIP